MKQRCDAVVCDFFKAVPAGKERTQKEFAELFAAAGFKLTRVVQTASPLSVVEAVCV